MFTVSQMNDSDMGVAAVEVVVFTLQSQCKTEIQ